MKLADPPLPRETWDATPAAAPGLILVLYPFYWRHGPKRSRWVQQARPSSLPPEREAGLVQYFDNLYLKTPYQTAWIRPHWADSLSQESGVITGTIVQSGVRQCGRVQVTRTFLNRVSGVRVAPGSPVFPPK
jgi:hypothetical protein